CCDAAGHGADAGGVALSGPGDPGQPRARRRDTAKREGDGATPAGIHRIAGLLYRPDRLPRPAPWAEPIGPGDLWCDDPADPA
ncbi:hypothetical protein NL338_26220, partial [Klebsiella pneumoniae]|nr:hypothetical protein [Klebsiella pneumoniae]